MVLFPVKLHSICILPVLMLFATIMLSVEVPVILINVKHFPKVFPKNKLFEESASDKSCGTNRVELLLLRIRFLFDFSKVNVSALQLATVLFDESWKVNSPPLQFDTTLFFESTNRILSAVQFSKMLFDAWLKRTEV